MSTEVWDMGIVDILLYEHFHRHARICAQTLARATHARLGMSPLGDISPASLLAGFPHLSRFIADAIADDDRALEGPL